MYKEGTMRKSFFILIGLLFLIYISPIEMNSSEPRKDLITKWHSFIKYLNRSRIQKRSVRSFASNPRLSRVQKRSVHSFVSNRRILERLRIFQFELLEIVKGSTQKKF